LDDSDTDLGGTGPLIVDVAGATPSKLVVALGKDGNAYLLDRTNLGGISTPVAQAQVAGNEIINGPAAHTTSSRTYVAFKGQGSRRPSGGGNLVGLKLGAASPPTVTTAWCADQNGEGSPMVTTPDGKKDFIVWALGAEGDQRLHGFDGDTGSEVYGGG